MKSWFSCLLLGFARLGRRPGRLIGACLLPLCVLAAGLLLPGESLNTPLEAGVCLPDDSPRAEALLECLSQTDPTYVRFHRADEDEIYARVAAGKWVCGFVLRDDFDDRVTARIPGQLATVIVSRAETMAPLLTEAFSAGVYHLRAPLLAADYAQQNGLADGAQLDALRAQIEAGAPDAMTLQTESIDGTPGQAPPRLGAATARAAVRGLAAIFLFLSALLLAGELDGLRREGWFTRTAAASGPFALRAGLGAAYMLAVTLLTAAAYALSEFFFADGSPDLSGLGLLAGYALGLTGLALLLGLVPGVRHVLAALLPFLPAVCLLLCPIFFDAARFFAPAGPLSRLLPPSWLLRALQGAAADGVLLWALGPVTLPAAALLSRRLH